MNLKGTHFECHAIDSSMSMNGIVDKKNILSIYSTNMVHANTCEHNG